MSVLLYLFNSSSQIEYYNHLAGIRGFKKLPDDIHVAYLLYTHRNIHKSLEFDPNRHRARWKTVRSAIDKVFTTSMFSVMIRDDFSESSLWCSKFEYEVEPLHDLTSNAYDEATKLALYLELSKTTLSRADHYDVMSLANATPDIALIGYQDNSSDQDDIVVIVHRTRGSWIQIASLLTIKLLDQKSSPVKYILDKDMSVFNSCYEKLGSMLDNIGGFWSNAWRDMCVKPELLNNHARLTFEDYLWEFFNVNIAGLHPYQQSVLMVLCGALHEAFYAMRSEDKKPIEGEVLLKMYSNDKCTGPYLSLVSHMLSSRVVKSSFLSNALKDVDATRVEYILGIWVAYVSSVHMMRAQLEYVNFNDYMMSISPVPMLTYTQKMLLSFMGGIAVLSFLTALIMGTIRCGRYRTILLVQRQQNMMFDSGSVGDDDSDPMSSARNEDTVR